MLKNLTSVYKILNVGYSKMELYQIKKGIVVIGDSGVGKSTMFSAIHDGSDSLCKMRNPVTKRMVIDYKPEITDRTFKIGHKKTAETLLPTIKDISGHEDMFIIDVCGLKDSDGDLTEISNYFLIKRLFNKIENLAIIIPFTLESIT